MWILEVIHVQFRTKIYTLKYERSWYIDHDQNSYTNGTWKREHNSKNIKMTNFRTQVILHSTCATFVSICCTFRCLQYFRVLHIIILIEDYSLMMIFFRVRVVLKGAHLNLTTQLQIPQGLKDIFIAGEKKTCFKSHGH